MCRLKDIPLNFWKNALMKPTVKKHIPVVGLLTYSYIYTNNTLGKNK